MAAGAPAIMPESHVGRRRRKGKLAFLPAASVSSKDISQNLHLTTSIHWPPVAAREASCPVVDLWRAVPRMAEEHAPDMKTPRECPGGSVAEPVAVLSRALARGGAFPTAPCLRALHSSFTSPGETCQPAVRCLSTLANQP